MGFVTRIPLRSIRGYYRVAPTALTPLLLPLLSLLEAILFPFLLLKLWHGYDDRGTYWLIVVKHSIEQAGGRNCSYHNEQGAVVAPTGLDDQAGQYGRDNHSQGPDMPFRADTVPTWPMGARSVVIAQFCAPLIARRVYEAVIQKTVIAEVGATTDR